MHGWKSTAIAATIAAAAIVAAGCGSDSSSEQTLKFTEASDSQSEFHPVAGASPSSLSKPGGGFTLGIPLKDSSGKNVGGINAVCFGTQGTGKTQKAACTGTADVPDGQLAINVGGSLNASTTKGAITGGTGKYDGASGTFESVNEKGKGATDTFTFTLPDD